MCICLILECLIVLEVKYYPGCNPCKAQAVGTLVAPQVLANVEGWRTPEVRRSKQPCVEIYILLRHYSEEYSFRLYPCRHADRKANYTPEIFGPKCMECTLEYNQSLNMAQVIIKILSFD